MKRLLIPLVILLVCAFIITGCSTGNTPTPTKPAATTPISTTPVATTPGATTPTATQPVTTVPATTSPVETNVKSGGVVRYITPTTPGTPIGWNPETSGGSVFSMQLSLQFLLKEQIDGSITPNLASSYEVVTDPANPSITFHLQKGVKFHDGSDFNAHAVKWNFEQVKAGGMNTGTTQFWKSFDVIDDHTIRVNMTTWQNRLIRSFADGVAFQASPAAFEKNGIEWMRWHMVGTGPFVQKEFLRDVSLTTTRNPDYWESGKPYLDGVNLLYVADEMTRLALFKSGGGEIMDTAGNGRIANELQASGYKIITQSTGATVLVPDSLNTDSPWSNLKVRQAAEYAIDKGAIAKTFGHGYYQAAYQLNSSASPAYDPEIAGRKYDAAKAKQLLTEAGYPNGFKTRIIASNTQNKDIIVAVQSYLSKVGIQCDLEIAEAAKYQQYLSGTWNNAIIFNPLLQWANPNTGFNFYFGVPRSSWFQSLKKPDNWETILTPSLIAPKVNGELAQKPEAALYEDCTLIPLYFGAGMYAVTDTLQDSHIGTRGAATWWEPQLTWLNK